MAIIPIRTGVFGDFSLTYDDVADTYQLDCESIESGIESFTWSGQFANTLNEIINSSDLPRLGRAVYSFLAFIARQ